MEKKFYGPNEIMGICEVDNSISEVILASGQKVLLSNKMMVETVKNIATDLTQLRDDRCFPVVSNILKVLLEWNVKIDEIAFIVERCIMSINETDKKANEKVWNVTHEEKTMQHVQNVLVPKK